ncbi:thioredoxin domain-containing protein [Microbacteriaceae bacterium]|nr:thioredoxin domain-containing protein [Candidatus Saccharibacteria bacterium]
MTKKMWIIFSVLCIAIIGGLIAISQGDKADVENINPATIQAASKGSGNIADHVSGNTSSKVVLIEYGDYQCPGCESAYPIVKQVTDKYSKQIAFVFRNYPLVQAHPNALSSASASEAAGLQGKYWEMHDRLYTDQASWKELSGVARTNYFVTSAVSLGMDGKKFTTDLDSADVSRKIKFDIALGKKINLTGTPTFYVNDKNVGDQYVKDGKIVPKTTDGAALIWSDASAFENLIIIPALKEKGIELPQ